MHLRFTEEELGTLVEMVSLAAEVASWNERPGSEEGVAAYEALEEKVLEKAKHAGLGDHIDFDEEKQRHHLSPEYQDGSFYQQCYDEFRNESFWDELAVRLSDRDLARAIGFKSWEALTEEHFGAPELPSAQVTNHQVDEILLIARWFRFNPDEWTRTTPPARVDAAPRSA